MQVFKFEEGKQVTTRILPVAPVPGLLQGAWHFPTRAQAEIHHGMTKACPDLSQGQESAGYIWSLVLNY